MSHSSQELLTKILLFAAESAANDALSIPASPNTANPTAVSGASAAEGASTSHDWMPPGNPDNRNGHNKNKNITHRSAYVNGNSSTSSSMSDFRRRASRAVFAARSVAEQRGIDPHDVETIILRLAKGWIHQSKIGAGTGGEARDIFVGGRGGRGMGDRESVFSKDAREVSEWVDCLTGAV